MSNAAYTQYIIACKAKKMKPAPRKVLEQNENITPSKPVNTKEVEYE